MIKEMSFIFSIRIFTFIKTIIIVFKLITRELLYLHIFLGMTDIARQTVEFLYEENGGIPRDLHLPTIEDIKEDLAKFTIERVKKGITVVIRTPSGIGTSGTAVLPKYAVRSMLRTFGLTGNVLDIDSVCISKFMWIFNLDFFSCFRQIQLF